MDYYELNIQGLTNDMSLLKEEKSKLVFKKKEVHVKQMECVKKMDEVGDRQRRFSFQSSFLSRIRHHYYQKFFLKVFAIAMIVFGLIAWMLSVFISFPIGVSLAFLLSFFISRTITHDLYKQDKSLVHVNNKSLEEVQEILENLSLELKELEEKLKIYEEKQSDLASKLEEIEAKILAIKKVIDVLRMKRSMAITQILTSYPNVEQELDDHFKRDQVNEKIVKLVREKEE